MTHKIEWADFKYKYLSEIEQGVVDMTDMGYLQPEICRLMRLTKSRYYRIWNGIIKKGKKYYENT